MEKILHHLGCPKRSWYWYKTNIWGILSGAGFFSSTVLLNIAHKNAGNHYVFPWKTPMIFPKLPRFLTLQVYEKSKDEFQRVDQKKKQGFSFSAHPSIYWSPLCMLPPKSPISSPFPTANHQDTRKLLDATGVVRAMWIKDTHQRHRSKQCPRHQSGHTTSTRLIRSFDRDVRLKIFIDPDLLVF